jgi:NAD(P)-dependent dehydrogenase (short-subunit alcohol dehydrogenase family)
MAAWRDKVMLITGGSSGIGRASALRFGRAGARLVLAARGKDGLDKAVAEVEGLGTQALAVPTDVAEPEQCRRAVEAAVERFGRLDVLLCCAGVSLRGLFADSRPDVLERVLRVNFLGVTYATLFAIPYVKKTRGSLAAVTSLTGKRGTPSYAVYGASKFAVHGLYESLRIELHGDGVHVGVVAPGFVDTPLRNQVLGPDGKVWPTPPRSPFRVWPVERCVDCIVDLLEHRRGEVLLPWFCRPLLALDELAGKRLGDGFIRGRFKPDLYSPP